ncbi:MAG: PAS domain S-box protein [Chitinophagaceae bacterium]|nr:PAS domain S-box protein [Chitinophagaceae bacterium]
MQNQIENIIENIENIESQFQKETLKSIVNNTSDHQNIYKKLSDIKKKLNEIQQSLNYNQTRLLYYFDVLIKYSQLSFSEKVKVNIGGDEIDAIGAGLNVLGEELAYFSEALKEKEQKIQTIISNAPDAIIVINSESIILNWNTAAEKLFGWKQDEVIDKPIYEILIPEAYREKHKRGLNHFLTTGESNILNKTIELEALRKNQSLVSIELTISPAKQNEQTIFIAFLRDNTIRKKNIEKINQLNATLEQKVIERTEALRRSELKYRNIFDNNPLPCWLLDLPTLKFIDVNEAAVNHYGYSREEFLRMTAIDIRPEEDKQRFSSLNREFREGTRDIGIWRHLKKDGTVISVEVKTHDLLIDHQLVRAVVVNDITAKLQAEQQLKYSEAKFRRIFESKLMGFIFWNKYGDILDANQVFLDIIKYTPEDLYEGKIKWVELTPKEYESIDQKALKQIEYKGYCDPFEKEYIRKDGSRVYILLAAAALSTDNLDEGVAYVLDISEKKAMEKEILELNANLEKKVEQRTEQLNQINKELESFSYSVSHDLRSPLRAIIGYSKMVLEDYDQIIDTEGKRLLNTIIQNSNKMGHLIDDLLEFSRMGKKAINKASINLTQIAKEAYQEIIRTNHYNAKVTIKNLGIHITDPVLISHVFQNLISNALKYSSKSEKPKIEIGLIKKPDKNIIYVKDNGCGFDMTYYNKLFGVFQRLHLENEYEGTGVGLALVQRIINRLGGTVYAEAELNKGATFYFTIPIQLH